jgi:dihydrofolate synthase/folylpolyglutamate synthase
LYTSPYLCRYHERIRVSGEPIDDSTLARLGDRLIGAYDSLVAEGVYPTTFELGTALAFLCFAERRVDIAVVEVGLGGRLDPTNVLSPAVCAIAPISIDHTRVLGETIPEIAGEKAGIIKPGVPLALSPQRPEADAVIARACAERNAPLFRVSDHPPQALSETAFGARFAYLGECYDICLPGHHQIENAATAVEALACLARAGFPLSPAAVARGLERARWPGRLEWLRRNLLIDGAHNVQGACSLRDYLKRYFPGARKILLTGMMRDKQTDECAEVLSGCFDEIVATQVDWPKVLEAGALADLYARRDKKVLAVPDETEALRRALALAGEDLLVVAGSLYLAGAVKSQMAGG